MITKKIFLASSSELKEDREEFERLVSRKNNYLVPRGVFLEVVLWEDFLDAMSQTGLQEEYNKAIRDFDIFVMLFLLYVNSILDFKEKLKQLGHFNTVDKNLDDLKFKFDQQLNKLVENGVFTQQMAGPAPVAAMPMKAPPIIGITLHNTVIEDYITGLHYPRKLRLYLSNGAAI
jgi:hypothetical protein